MRFVTLVFACVLAGLPVSASAAAQSGASGDAAAAAAPAPLSAAPLSASLAKLQFTAADLPKGITIGEGVHCISVQAVTFFRDPAMVPLLPAPQAKVSQSFRKGSSVLGTVLAFEYEGGVPDQVRKFVPALIWGEDGPTKRHPEQILMHGSCLVILSFELGTPQAKWFKEQVESRLGMPVPRDWSGLDPLMDKVFAAFKKNDPASGLALLRKNAEAIKDYALAQYFVGEFALMLDDWPTAVAGYTRAVELDDSGADKLDPASEPPTLLWASLDGLGSSLLATGQLEASIPVLERAVALGRTLGNDKDTSHALYNMACSLARLERFDECLATLAECLKLEPSWKASVLKDTDLAEALKRPEFQKLMAG